MNYFINMKRDYILTFSLLIAFVALSNAQGTRLLRQPTVHTENIAFAYGGDIWLATESNPTAVRITSTPAVEKDPYFSPNGKFIAFTSNRSGSDAVYVVSVNGGDAKRLTWHPSQSRVRGWTPDGNRILYASSRETAPTSIDRLWTISMNGGPAEMLSSQWGTSGSFNSNGKQIVIDRVRRWDIEWRAYRGGQNTPLVILNLSTSKEVLIPNDRTTDTQPLWLGDRIYFLSDKDYTTNIYTYDPKSKSIDQLTNFKGTDVKSLAGFKNKLIYERDGFLNTLDLNTNKSTQLEIDVIGDFPWAATKWEDVTRSARSASLSPNGKRIIMESRGEIFTVPVEDGDARNLTTSSGVADRAPLWSPKGDQIAWFSDRSGIGYELLLAGQDGLSKPRSISIGESKMAWEPICLQMENILPLLTTMFELEW